MNKKSKALLVVTFFLIVASLGFTYYKTVVVDNFEVTGTEEIEEAEETEEIPKEDENLSNE